MARSEPCFVVLDVMPGTDKAYRFWLPLPGNEDTVAEAVRWGWRFVGVAVTVEGLERLMAGNRSAEHGDSA